MGTGSRLEEVLMPTRVGTAVVRADVVGSLLRPEYLREAKDAVRAGTIEAGELRAVEDRAVLEAIALQESAGIEAITDGEYRRHGWIALIPMIDDPLFRAPVSGFEFLDADSGWRDLWKTGAGEPADLSALPPEEPFVVRRLEVDRDIVTDEYAFLREHANARTKYTIPAPSWHRTYWHPEYSTDAYPTSDEFIADVARLTREHVVDRLVELGCDYIQIDAPNYAQWHIDPGNRAAFERHGHDMAHELAADAEFDSMVFEGLTGVTRAMHMCRGNAPGGMWAASGGYEAISREVFPRLENIDRLLLEYDSDRAGGFAPLADVLPHHEIVLGLVTTKDGKLEDPDNLVSRVEEATQYVPLEQLAVSPQCGFASGEIARTMTLDEQEAKLRLVGEVARRIWG
jgi:5-methyltetrahydropteroyltriglutamate--homocysteine methyltransferase